jgi:hypothetical protein
MSLLNDPCPSPHYSHCNRVSQQVRDGWAETLSRGWMNDPPPICLELQNALQGAFDFDEAWAGSSGWVEGVAEQGGNWFVITQNSSNFLDGDLEFPTPMGLTVMLHEALHMAGYTHKSSQSGHPKYIPLAEFRQIVASCHADAIIPL